MASESSGSDNLVVKIIGGAFATVIAPILVALALKLTDNATPAGGDAPNPAAAKPVSQAAGRDDRVPSGPDAPSRKRASVQGEQLASADPITPARNHADRPLGGVPGVAPTNPADGHLLRLFNGVDMTGFYTWLAPTKPRGTPIGKNHDPNGQFTVDNGKLRITGPIDGGLVTEKEYESYQLTVVYRWGRGSSPPRNALARQGGILLHCAGDDGAVRERWMRSVRCDLTEGAAGCLRMVGSIPNDPISFTVTAEMRYVQQGEKHEMRYRYEPNAALTTLTGGYVNQLAHDPNWENVKGFRGMHTREKPVGKWNHVECVCVGGKIAVRMNGTKVNEIGDLPLRKGKIMIQALGSEIFIREITLKPLVNPVSAGK